MNTPVYIAIHTVVAGVVFYFLQSRILGETFEISVIWGLAGAAGAGALAYIQSRK